MHIKQVVIENFKCIEGRFALDLQNGMNILVGDNEVGKSSVLEAIHLALSGWFHGKYLKAELTQSLFNNQVVEKYLESLKTGTLLPAPHILIELFFEIEEEKDSLKALFEGNKNVFQKKECGIQFKISLTEEGEKASLDLISKAKPGDPVMSSLPIEDYEFAWTTFARESRTPRTINPHFKSALIDSSSFRYQNGSDIYVSQIVRNLLSEEQKLQIAQAHRKMKDGFMEEPIIKSINTKIAEDSISGKKIGLSIDLSTKNAWEKSLITCLDDVPFHFVGKGEQCLVKTKLALKHNRAEDSNILLIEEPENHLSHSKLNQLMNYINENNAKKQIIISTHSSFVANKLGLNSLILLNKDAGTGKLSDFIINSLNKETREYFEKLPGYDTLRLILCQQAILVEGDCDELVVQKAYLETKEKLPIEDGVDVISVRSLAFKRFLSIADALKQPVAVVTDSDGDIDALKEKYKDYLGPNAKKHIRIFYDDVIDSGKLKIGKKAKDYNYNTLEPKLLKENGLKKLNTVFGTTHADDESIQKYMYNNKAPCALKIFSTTESMEFPKYILDAINWKYVQ